jgi:hypothetical protein
MKSKIVTEWYGKFSEAERFPDLAFWAQQSDAYKMDTAWQMTIEAHLIKGEDLRESRLQRAIGGLQRREG